MKLSFEIFRETATNVKVIMKRRTEEPCEGEPPQKKMKLPDLEQIMDMDDGPQTPPTTSDEEAGMEWTSDVESCREQFDEQLTIKAVASETWQNLLEYLEQLEQRVQVLERKLQENNEPTKKTTKDKSQAKESRLQAAMQHVLKTGMSLRDTVKIKNFRSVSKSNLHRVVKEKKEEKEDKDKDK